MTPDEVRMLDNSKALLFIRGEYPVMDDKFDILKHPGVSMTPDGGAKPYLHGQADAAVAQLTWWRVPASEATETEEPNNEDNEYELLSNDELEAIFLSD